MSLLRSGRHVVTVFPQTVVEDEWGNEVRVPDMDNPIDVRGSLQPSTSEELTALGQVGRTVMRFISLTWPGGPWSLVRYGGRDWDVVGEPRVFDQTSRVAHCTVYLTARSASDGVHTPGD